jgi:8-oxo-dGTP pyrophosphatase MutT (NUDIX family)
MLDDLRAGVHAAWRKFKGLRDRIRWMGPEIGKTALSIALLVIAFRELPADLSAWPAFAAANASSIVEVALLVAAAAGLLASMAADRVRLELVRHSSFLQEADIVDSLRRVPEPASGPQPTARDPGVHTDPLDAHGCLEVLTVEDHGQRAFQQALLTDRSVNRALDACTARLLLVRREARPHPVVKAMLRSFLWRMPEAALDTFDDAKLSLRTDIDHALLDGSRPVRVQRTSYYLDRWSNTLANYIVRVDDREVLDLRREVVERRRLVPLAQSRLSNQMGASTLLLTRDGHVVYLKQGNRTAENSGRLAPAGSGSFDFPRGGRGLDGSLLRDFVCREAARELREECGLDPADLIDVQVTGFGRFLYRNGKPEFFCVATTVRDAADIEVPVNEWDYQFREVRTHRFRGFAAYSACAGLDEFIAWLRSGATGTDRVSGPLLWAAMLARDYLSVDDERRKGLFRHPPG